jgi:hypothetical protein
LSKPYDAGAKYLIEDRLPDWLPLSGRPSASARVIDADVSTVTAAADKVLYVESNPPWIMHLEVQASRDAELPARLHVYNTLLHQRHRIPVQTVAVLLRPAADSANLTGGYTVCFPGEEPYVRFGYSIVRVWQQPLERLLSAGPGLLPLSLLCDEAAEGTESTASAIRNRSAAIQGRGLLDINAGFGGAAVRPPRGFTHGSGNSRN